MHHGVLHMVLVATVGVPMRDFRKLTLELRCDATPGTTLDKYPEESAQHTDTCLLSGRSLVPIRR